jgi:hypothetical protein
MLMRPPDGRVDDQVFEVRIIGQGLEKTLPNPGPRPAPEAPVDTVPRAEVSGQIAPRRAGARDPQDGIDKQPRVCARATGIALLAGNQRRNPRPLRVAQQPPNQDRLLQKAVLNHNFPEMGIPYM